MKKYVAGFLFDEECTKVALIHKNHGPAAIVGHWNAIGGKRSVASAGQDESAAAAMWREFVEETGSGHGVRWTPFLVLRSQSSLDLAHAWQVDFFHGFHDAALKTVRTAETEEVRVWPLTELPDVVPNLRWIIPMALGHDDDHVRIYEVIEKDAFTA